MNSTEISTEDVTAATVTAAEAEAAEAERALVELETRLTGGDLTVTADQLSAQERIIRHAKLAAAGVRSLWTTRQEQDRVKAIADLRKEVLAAAPKSGDDLVAALKVVEKAARAFESLAAAHDERLKTWAQRVHELGVPDGRQEQGIGVNGIHQVQVGPVTLQGAYAQHRLRALFLNKSDEQGGGLTVRQPGDSDLAAHYAALDAIGGGL